MLIVPGAQFTQGADEYVIGALLASGGFGSAFLAERTKPTKLSVVVKVPHPEYLTDPVWSQKFAREARILANINHPHVVRIVAYWEFPTTGEKALIQELVVGAMNLSTYLGQHPDRAASTLLQALYALRAIHTRTNPAVVHRDISPVNLLVGADGRLQVIDFGLAKEDPRATKMLTQVGSWFGTPGCMAPEQYSDAANVDHRADIYATGRTFAACIQQRPPTNVDLHLLDEPWRSLCGALTEYDPARRPQTAEAALVMTMQALAAAGVVLTDFPTHVEEMQSSPPLPGWSQLAELYFRSLPDIPPSDLALASRLHPQVFAAGRNNNGFFDMLEKSTAMTDLSQPWVDFEEADPFATLYEKLYPHLDGPRRIQCFDRACDVALRLHRYSVMIAARTMWNAERDPTVKAKLLAVHIARDPAKVIHGIP